MSGAEPSPVLAPPSLAEVRAALELHAQEWRALGVTRVRVFGSVARGDSEAESDVDVLLGLQPGSGLLTLVRAGELFEELLGRRTDAVTEGGLKAGLRAGVLADALDLQGIHPAERQRSAVKHGGLRAAEMLDCLERVGRHTAGLDRAAFLASELVQDAVLRNLAQLGEVSKYIPESVQVRWPDLPWNELRRLRNLIAHDYFGIDRELLWQTVTAELPPLRGELERLAEQGERQPAEGLRLR